MAVDVSSSFHKSSFGLEPCPDDIPCWCCWSAAPCDASGDSTSASDATTAVNSKRPQPSAIAMVYRNSQEHAAWVERLEATGSDGALGAFARWLESRDVLLTALNLPATAHNSMRLYDAAVASEPLASVLVDVDSPLPMAVRGDEVLLLTAMADYFHQRGIEDSAARIYDIEAFLEVPHHDHNAAAIGSWLACELPFYAMLASLVADLDMLMHEVA